MALGRGLESLIPPQEDRNKINNAIPPESGEFVVADGEEIEVQGSSPKIEIVEVEDIQSLSAVYPKEEQEEKTGGTIFQIEVDRIRPNPNQPRRDFDEEGLRELATSIREFGVLQPLLVSKVEHETDTGWSVYYELVAGERRLMASKMAGLHTVPVVVRKEPSDREKLELAVIENIQRSDLNPIEFARAVARLQDEFGLTQREIAVRLGKSREVIANAVRLLGLPTEIQNAVASGEISESHARLLLSVEDKALQNEAFEDIVKYKLNVREANSRIRKGRGAERTKAALTEINPEIASLKTRLEEFLGTKIDLQSKGASGKITIAFYSPEELEAIVYKVVRNNGDLESRQNDNRFPSPPLDP